MGHPTTTQDSLPAAGQRCRAGFFPPLGSTARFQLIASSSPRLRLAHWNKIEHRLFGQITTNWRGKPLVTLEAVVALIANTTTKTGLKVRAAADQKSYPTGKRITDDEMEALAITRGDFHGDWNYVITPRVKTPKKR